jgi:predicted enzyme related to lactoylglutathione lyase
MALRLELFPDDIDASVDFWVRVMAFAITVDRRATPEPYASLVRGDVRIGLVRREAGGARAREARRPPLGVEIVLEVEAIHEERDRILATGWQLDEDLQDRPWGLADFRLLDPAGYYVRVTHRPA